LNERDGEMLSRSGRQCGGPRFSLLRDKKRVFGLFRRAGPASADQAEPDEAYDRDSRHHRHDRQKGDGHFERGLFRDASRPIGAGRSIAPLGLGRRRTAGLLHGSGRWWAVCNTTAADNNAAVA
jgi:hypothetical protein